MAGTKISIVDHLRAAPRFVPRAITLAHELEARESSGGLSPEILFAREAEIEQAIQDAHTMVNDVKALTQSLSRARPIPMGQEPAGF